MLSTDHHSDTRRPSRSRALLAGLLSLGLVAGAASFGAISASARPAPQSETAKVTIYFGPDSSTLTASAKRSLNRFVAALPDAAVVDTVKVTGHVRAQPNYTTPYQRVLSKSRAAKTAAFLSGLGVDGDYTVRGAGVLTGAIKSRNAVVVLQYHVDFVPPTIPPTDEPTTPPTDDPTTPPTCTVADESPTETSGTFLIFTGFQFIQLGGSHTAWSESGDWPSWISIVGNTIRVNTDDAPNGGNYPVTVTGTNTSPGCGPVDTAIGITIWVD